MPNDINELDESDYGLKQIFGERFTDCSEKKDSTKAPATKKTEPARVDEKESKPKVKDAQWVPVKERNWMDNLKSCAKSTVLLAGLNMLIWYWQTAGLMADSIALPCMLVCAVLCGLNIGKVMGGQK